MTANEANLIRDPVTNAVVTMDYASTDEKGNRDKLIEKLRQCPIPDHSILSNLGLFFNSKTLSRILFLHEFYKMGVNVQGQLFDFGTRWGQNMAVFIACRGMYEPFNRHRKIIGFDTFEGFPKTAPEDGASQMIGVGNIPVTSDYETYLEDLLTTLELNNALPHLKKYELVKGDACETIVQYFEENKHAIVSHAFFDFDLYKPTRDCLKLIWERAPIGAVIGFDEANDEDSPGETVAIDEVLGLGKVRLQRFPWVSRVSYLIKEG